MINEIKKYFCKNKKTINNFIWRSLQIFGKQGITFLIFILCAKLLSPYYFGIYNYILAIIFFLIMFGDFGISTAVSKYTTEYNEQDKEKLRSIIFNSSLLIVVLSFIIIIMTITIGPVFLKEKYLYVLYLLPMIFLAPMTSLYDGVYRGLNKFKLLAIISLITGFISISIAYFLIGNFGLIGALISQNIFYALLLICLIFSYRDINFKINKNIIIEIGRYSLSIGISVLGYYLFSRVGIIIMGYFGYIDEISVYELLNKIFMILLMPITILGTVLFPYFTELNINKRYDIILIKFKKYSYFFLLISIIFIFISYLFLPVIIKLFFSNYYNEILFTLLIPVILIYASQVYCSIVSSSLMVATGYAKLLGYWNLLAGLLNLFLSLILIKFFGYIGVIYSILILHILMIFSTHVIFYMRIKNNINKNA